MPRTRILVLTGTALAPFFAMANGAPASFKDWVMGTVVPLGNALMGLFFALGFIAFLIGIVRFFFMGGEENREKGKQFAFWGIIGFAVLFSMWGLVQLLLKTVGFQTP